MSENDEIINLYRQLESLHFLNVEESLALFLQLCLYAYLSRSDIRKKLSNEYSIEEQYVLRSIIEEINSRPNEAFMLFEDARRRLANAGKSKNAKEILGLVFDGPQSISAFSRVAIKNQNYNKAIITILREIEKYKDISIVPQYAVGLTGARFGTTLSINIAKIISAYIGNNKEGDFYDPISGDISLTNAICFKNNISKLSFHFRNRYDAVLSLSISILSGHSFDDISFCVDRYLTTTHLDGKKYNLIVTNVPANMFIGQDELFAYAHDEALIDCFNMTRPLLETIVLKKIMNAINDGGRAFMVIAGNLLSNQKNSARQFRSLLVDSGLLKSIIKIPAGALLGTSVESYIIILEKKINNTVSFIDSSGYFDLFRGNATIDKRNVEKLLDDINKNQKAISASVEDIKNDNYRLNVSYYTDTPKLMKVFRDGNCKKLSEVATLIESKSVADGKSYKVVNSKYLSYPFNPKEMCSLGDRTILLNKNDIIIYGSTQSPKVYYIQDEVKGIYAPKNSIVVRSPKIQPEYLAIYLASDAAKTALELVGKITKGGKSFFNTIYINNDLLSELPVPAPTKKPEEYEERFRIENKYHIRYEDLLLYLNENDGKEKKSQSTIDEILDEELLRSAPRYKKEIFETSMERDIQELKICYTNGAYKAATILAGSILEAILIDWVSEIYKKNYFKEPFTIVRNGHEKEAKLADYIDQIEFIKRPEWLKEANEAHHIRKMRNSVHAKVSISSTINKTECNKVIEYLQDVLTSRSLNS